jgi:hypothetical protein
MRLVLYLFLLFIFIGITVNAQTIRGSVVDAETGMAVVLVDVININTGAVAHTTVSGSYTLFARPGDTIIYSGLGYKPVKRIKSSAPVSEINISLNPLSYELDDFTYRFNSLKKYQADSANRAATYKLPLQRTHPSPINSPASAIAEAFSKKAKNTYHFQKVFAETELDKFIDTRYTPELVTLMTKLTGDSIGFFMYAHPMPYEYARTATDLELKMWIREKYKSWVKK